jgi:hypothetical protein
MRRREGLDCFNALVGQPDVAQSGSSNGFPVRLQPRDKSVRVWRSKARAGFKDPDFVEGLVFVFAARKGGCAFGIS